MPAFAQARARQTADHATTAFVARVHAMDDVSVFVVAEDDPTERLPVIDRVPDVGALQDGDRVVACPVRGGAVVTVSLTRTAEGARRLPDGRLLVQAAEGVVLQAGEARIELQPDGRLLIHGRNVEHRADQALALQASVVEIN
ncbi:hypothetical protein [Aquisalimonas asiatica]|uniref:Uncharacterized protein n=1 Tax=Aquisalimonas asiatica TaxID=406100 RepID=A0A1H8V609_9GAMM|nr:hypothetical protein [Aquisalimonas asiatica]SEP10693.1 hypothetical protein SAMN04488052_1108 [Aquisalimonas asiatica]